MSEQQYKQTSTREQTETIEALPEPSDKGERLKEELDDLMDEIDEVLEQNAAEFVSNYVQKGGQ